MSTKIDQIAIIKQIASLLGENKFIYVPTAISINTLATGKNARISGGQEEEVVDDNKKFVLPEDVKPFKYVFNEKDVALIMDIMDKMPAENRLSHLVYHVYRATAESGRFRTYSEFAKYLGMARSTLYTKLKRVYEITLKKPEKEIEYERDPEGKFKGGHRR